MSGRPRTVGPAVTLQELAMFCAVVRTGSVGRAARHRRISQPAVSHAVGQLEKALGLPLFTRQGHGLVLSPEGRLIHEYAAQIVGLFGELQSCARATGELERGTLVVGAGATLGTYYLPQVLGAFKRLYPGIEVRLRFGSLQELLAGLTAGQFDLIVTAGPARDGPGVARLWSGHLLVVAPPGHPLVAAHQVSLDRLIAETFIVREPGSWGRDVVERMLKSAGLTFGLSLELTYHEAMKRAVEHGLGVAALPASAVQRELDAGILAVIEAEGFPIPFDCFAEWNAASSSRLMHTFVDFLIQQAGESDSIA